MNSYQQLKALLADVLGVSEEELGPDTRLSRKGGVDAVSLARLVIKAERAFKVSVRDEDLADLPRLTDLAGYLDAQREDGAGDYAPPSDKAREAWYYE